MFSITRNITVFSLLLFTLISIGYSKRADRIAWSSPNFIFNITRDSENRLSELSLHFEKSFKVLTEFYDYTPDEKIKVWFLDEDDYGNGGAVSLKGWVAVSLKSADFQLRGRRLWLENVISHELSHIISLQKMGVKGSYLGLSLGYGYQSERTGTSIHGDIPADIIPAWLAEGFAQYGSLICGNDTLDSHRRMLIKNAVINNQLLTLKEMESFSGNSRDNEMVYNQGFYFVSYLYSNYSVREINRFMALVAGKNFHTAYKLVFKKSLFEEYQLWHMELKKLYRLSGSGAHTSHSGQPYLVQSPMIPVSPNNSYIYYSSEYNSAGIPALIYKQNNRQSVIKQNINPFLFYEKNFQIALFIVNSKHSFSNFDHNTLFALDLKTMKTRMYGSEHDHVFNAVMQPDGTVYGLFEANGKTGLLKYDKDGSSPVLIKVLNPENLELRQLSPGLTVSSLLISTTDSISNDIFQLDLDTGALTPLLNTEKNERDVYCSDGAVYFSADYSGTYNIYMLKDGEILRLTDCEFGCFTPYQDNGVLYYSNYGRQGFTGKSQIMDPSQFRIMNFESGRETIAHNNVDIPPYQVSRSGRSGDGTPFLGYGLRLSVDDVGYSEITVPDYSDSTGEKLNPWEIYDYALDPYYVFSGGIDWLWMHPGGESGLVLGLTAGENFNENFSEFYLRNLTALYFNQFAAHNFFFGFKYMQETYEKFSFAGNNIKPEMTGILFQSEIEWPLGRYFSSSSIGVLNGMIFRDAVHDEVYEGAGMFALGQTLDYNYYQPGIDFLYEGFQIKEDVLVVPVQPSVWMFNHYVKFNGNWFKKVFFHLTGKGITIRDFETNRSAHDYSFSLGLDLSMFSNQAPGKPYSWFVLKDVFPFYSFDQSLISAQTAESQVIPMMKNQSLIYSHGNFGPGMFTGPNVFPYPVNHLHQAGLKFKILSPLANIVYWNCYTAFYRDINNAVFGINVSM